MEYCSVFFLNSFGGGGKVSKEHQDASQGLQRSCRRQLSGHSQYTLNCIKDVFDRL